MARTQAADEQRRPAPRLYVALPAAADPAQQADRLANALGAADVAAVLMPLAGDDERALLNRIKAVAPAVQCAGAALLLNGRPDLVARSGADGAHLADIEAFNAAFAALKPERIVGCGGLVTRHDAMLAAEAGADYVMFGEPDEAGRRPSFAAILERVEWWAQVFEVPCVGYAAAFDEIEPLAAAGADFVAAGGFIFDDPRGPAAALADAAGKLSLAEAAG